MRVTGAPAHTVIAFSYLLIILYALTLAPICWVYAAEVWSLETRATGMGIAAVGNWLFNFAIGLFIPPAFLNIRWRLFIVFGTLCLAGAIQFYLTYPEVSSPFVRFLIDQPLTSLFRPAARLSKRSRFCSARTDPTHGTRTRVTLDLTGRWWLSRMRRQRARPEPVSKKLFSTRRRPWLSTGLIRSKCLQVNRTS